MERLASCYFCGADAQLTEHQVLPEALDPDGQATAMLCPTCRRKLEGVVELVLEAAGTAPAADDRGTVDTPVQEPADGPETGGDEPADETVVAADEPADETMVAADEPGAVAEEPVDDLEMAADEPAATEEPTAAETDDAEVIGGPAAEQPEKPDPLDGVSVMEYNRVMRLLQNREFPINRGEFEVVAQEAYDLSAQTVSAVLDAVVARGLLIEEDGELARPGERSGGDDD